MQDTLAREDVSTQGMLARWHVSAQVTLASEQVGTQSTLARGHVRHTIQQTPKKSILSKYSIYNIQMFI